VTPCLDRREATDRRSKRGSGARMREE
jgi:hypothetical protein